MRDTLTWFLDDLWDGLRARRGRTALALFAICIGMFSLTILVAVLGGLQRRAERIVRELGAHVIAVSQDGQPARDQLPLSREAAGMLARNLPSCRISAVRSSRAGVPGLTQEVAVLATDQHLAALRQWPMQAGRWLDAGDLKQRSRHAVISAGLARDLGWRVSEVVLVRDTPFVIVGICRSGGEAVGLPTGGAVSPGDRTIFVPLTVPPYWETQGENRSERVDTIFLQAAADGEIHRLRERAQRMLEAPPGKTGPLAWVTPELLLTRLRGLQRTVRFTAGSVVVLCLLLGGTTLMSLMVAAVRERVHEIGLRRSLGATPRDIAALFASEACLVTLAATAAGTLAAHLALWIAAGRLPVPIALGPASLLIPAAGAVVLGVTFAYAPARSAARIQPAEALRNP